MSEWFYIRFAFGLAWGVIGGYMFLLHRRRVAAERAMNGRTGGDL